MLEVGWGVDGGWMPLPTRPQRYCDPVSLVLFHIVVSQLSSLMGLLGQNLLHIVSFLIIVFFLIIVYSLSFVHFCLVLGMVHT